MSRKLHIGGTQVKPGWEILNANDAPYVDHRCDARDLACFPDNTFEAIYASHILEHFDYQNDVEAVLKEWFRVLAPGGKAYISVPDMDILARLLLDRENLNLQERYSVMRMIFGGHVDQYDYHYVGLNQDFLASFLTGAGFVNILRVSNFGLFDDTSSKALKGTPISLNVIAHKPAS